MSLATQRKASTTNQAGTVRDIKDHPAWIEALETQRRLQDEAATIENEIRKVEGLPVATPRQNRIANLIKTIFAKVSTSQIAKIETRTATPETNPATVWERQEAIQTAMRTHETDMQRLRFNLVHEIYKVWEQEHLDARKRIAAAVVELKTSWDSELLLAHSMHAAGALTSALPGNRLLCNFSNCGPLPSVLQGMNLQGFIATNKNLLT